MSPRLPAMTDRERLLALLDMFESALADFTDLVRELGDEEWELPTDLPGWTVHDLVSHTAHLEAVLAGSPEETVVVPQGLPHVTSLMGFYTEQGVIARKERSRDELLAEIGAAVGRRLGETRAAPPDDGAGDPPKTPGDIGWSWQTLLSNRPLDVWMHEQDIRRATDRPGHLDSAAARHAVRVFARRLGYVWGKKVGAAPGESGAIELSDSGDRFAVILGENGRGVAAPEDATTDATLRMDTGTFVVLCGGRRAPETQHVDVGGNPDLGERFRRSLSMTP